MLQRRLGGAQRRLTRRWTRNSVPLGGRASPFVALEFSWIGTYKTSKVFNLTQSSGAARPPNEKELSHRWAGASVANAGNSVIKSNVDFTTASGWLERLVRPSVY